MTCTQFALRLAEAGTGAHLLDVTGERQRFIGLGCRLRREYRPDVLSRHTPVENRDTPCPFAGFAVLPSM